MPSEIYLPEPEIEDLRPQDWAEPIAQFLARSTMTVAITLRAWINDGLRLAPLSARADLLGRLRRDDQFRSVIWELACARVLIAMGYDLDWHPAVSEVGNTKRPDWLVLRDGTPSFYFEARVLEEETDPEEARILDELNRVSSPDFWLMPVRILRRGERSASTRKLRQAVESYVAALTWRDPAAEPVDAAWDDDSGASPRTYPRHVWQCDGWMIEVGVRPKSLGGRGDPTHRPVGMHMGRFVECTVAEQLRRQVKKKISKYGRLDLPLVVGVRIVDIAHDDNQIADALLGTTVYTFARDGGDGTWDRKRDGLLSGGTGIQGRRLSALLVASRLSVATAEPSRVRVWFHPQPHHALDPLLLPFASTGWDPSSGERVDSEGSLDWDELVRRPIEGDTAQLADDPVDPSDPEPPR